MQEKQQRFGHCLHPFCSRRHERSFSTSRSKKHCFQNVQSGPNQTLISRRFSIGIYVGFSEHPNGAQSGLRGTRLCRIIRRRVRYLPIADKLLRRGE
jgi:hypothetical protein